MKLARLDVEGYRSLKKVSWTPGDLNVLIGPNASGKTNLIRALELLRESALGRLGDYVASEGGMRRMGWDYPDFTNLGLAVETNVSSQPLDPFIGPSAYKIRLSNDLVSLMESKASSCAISSESLTIRRQANNSDLEWETILERGASKGRMQDVENQEMILDHERLDPNETMLSIDFPVGYTHYTIHGMRTFIGSWHIYRDVWGRVYSQRPGVFFGLSSSVRMPVQPRHEKHVSADGGNLVQVLHTHYEWNRDFRNNLDLAMKAAFGEDFERIVFAPAADQLIQMRLEWKNLKSSQSAADLSDGTLRFLFLIAALADPDPPPLIAIEEPELGLHPSMLPIVAEYAREASRRSQVILTTHSPEFLDAFGDDPPTTTVFASHEGETKLAVLERDELAEWVKSYRLGELHRAGDLDIWLKDRIEDEESEADTSEAGQ